MSACPVSCPDRRFRLIFAFGDFRPSGCPAKSRRLAKGNFSAKFSSGCCESDLTHHNFSPILCCLLGVVCPSSSASGVFGACSWKDLYSRNIARRIGSKERPEWDASPAKPSKPLRIEAKRVVLPLGVRAEFLAGLRNRSTPFSVVCSRAVFLCAQSESCRNVRAIAG